MAVHRSGLPHCTVRKRELTFPWMIRHFETGKPLEPENPGHLQWGAALGAGLLAGLVLLVAPRGSPWASLTFFTPMVMGRRLTASMMLPLPVLWVIHLAVGVLYGLIISAAVSRLTSYRAILIGGFIGLLLYFANWGIVSACWPGWRTDEVPVIFTHVVFGLLCAGAYRGLLRRRQPVSRASL